jgi:NADH-quinone oxidoreductase subunit H
MFFLAEYANLITASALITMMFCGGWQIPWIEQTGLTGNTLAIVQLLGFIVKVVCWIFFFIWVRWSVPRFRYDQLMRLGWKVMLPLAIANFLLTGIVMLFLA